MFNNARHYNQETSQVYKDAETLERILRLKVRSFPSAATAALDGTAQAQALLHKKYVVTILSRLSLIVVVVLRDRIVLSCSLVVKNLCRNQSVSVLM